MKISELNKIVSDRVQRETHKMKEITTVQIWSLGPSLIYTFKYYEPLDHILTNKNYLANNKTVLDSLLHRINRYGGYNEVRVVVLMGIGPTLNLMGFKTV